MLKLNSISKSIQSFTYSNGLVNPNEVLTWTGYGTTISKTDDTLIQTAGNSISYPYAGCATGITAVTGQKIYIRSICSVTNSVSTSLILGVQATGLNSALKNVSNPLNDNEYVMDNVLTIAAGVSGSINIITQHTYADAATANGKVLKFKNTIAINLTNLFGSGNEPSSADCSNIFKFVDGTKQPNFSQALIL